MGGTVSGADPKTFEVLLGYYALDANSVFNGRSRSQKIDRATFRALNAHFGVDANNAYCVTTPIEDADPHSFRVLDASIYCSGRGPGGGFLTGGYAADNNSVWCCGSSLRRLKTADTKSFVSLGNLFGCDQEHVYFEHAMLSGADRATWRRWCGEHLSVDKDSVFFTSKKISGVDRASICALECDDCFMDRHRIYCGLRVISPEEYLASLKHKEGMCAWEREWIPSGKLFERLLDEWPQHV